MTQKHKILITGGAGYIGSHMVKLLLDNGFQPLVLDKNPCPYPTDNLTFIQGDVGDKALLSHIFKNHNIDSVMHFAASIEVAKSVVNPSKYYQNNVVNSINLLDAMVEYEVNNFIFSSSAAIFGHPQDKLIGEDHPTNPISPYGNTKLIIENILSDYANAYGLKFGALRYFNACGAHPGGELGENRKNETHLIPLLLQVASGKLDHIKVFGDDYDTADGTCIRDYIHVMDICQAHLSLLEYIKNGGQQRFFNIGSGDGYSVLQVIKAVQNITGKNIAYEVVSKRSGDPAILLADNKKAYSLLSWQPKFSDLQIIIDHACRYRSIKLV